MCIRDRDIKEEQIILKPKQGYKGTKIKSKLKVPLNYHFNPNLYELRFSNDSAPLKILIFRDSFGQALSKFLKESFGETLFIWKRTFNHALIEAYQPDIIIDEVVERNVDLFLDAQ